MPLFKRKDQNLIPPVASESNSTSPRPVRSSAATYVPSRDAHLYNSMSSSSSPALADGDSVRDRYGRSRGVGDVYSRGAAYLDQDRNELFSGYNPEKVGSGRFLDGPDVHQNGGPMPGQETEEDIEGIKIQTRFVKQESVNSTRNALRIAREAEDTARNTLLKLGGQSEKLANTERHLDVAKGHSARAEDNTNELKQLNRSIFRPVITWDKEAKRAAKESKIRARYDEERIEREKTMMELRDSQNRIGRAATYGRGGDNEEGIAGGRSRLRTAEQQTLRQEQRKRFQFDATASDDEMEDEIDNNLDEISDAAGRLKILSMTMGQELDDQNRRLDVIEEKTDNVDRKIYLNTQKLKRIK